MSPLSGKSAPERVQHGFRFIQSRCTGCRTCVVACKDFHGMDDELQLRSVGEYTGGTWTSDDQGAWTPDVFSYYLSMSCNHCSNPLCLRFCGSDALGKDERGFVFIDAGLCVGCQLCMMACPYHAPRFDERAGVAVKCDGCRGRVAAGFAPVCVEACPQRALSAGPFAELPATPDAVSALAPLPAPELTQPNLLIEPVRSARPTTDQSGRLANPREA